jgi:pimeloyl-ACP methyl ester carboxylesterase
MSLREEVEFPTVDGITIKGNLYPAAEKGPGIILTPGFNFTKEMLVGDVAEYFQRAGLSALAFDPRSVGQSEGSPRNDIDPLRNVGDYHDALTFLKSHARVDATRIFFWGYSYSGVIALVASALDKRAAAIIAVCPLTIWDYPAAKWTTVLRQAMRDRESRVAGNRPVYVPMLNAKGENPAGFGAGFNEEHFALIAGAKEVQPDFQAPTTLNSYYNIAAFQPLSLMRYVTPTPAMVVVPSEDVVSPTRLQKELIWDVLSEPKRLLEVDGKGHIDVLGGADFQTVLDAQIEFLWQF